MERGNLLSHAEAPARTAHRIRARVFWLHDTPLEANSRIQVNIGTASERAVVSAISKAIDPGLIAPVDSADIRKYHVGEIELTFDDAVGCDPYSVNPVTGRIVLEYQGRIAGGGLILETYGAAQVRPLPTASAVSLQQGRQRADQLSHGFNELRPAERIKRLRESIDGKIIFTTSFGLEDQVVLHWIADLALDIDVVTLDTGRLFAETYAVWAETEKRYGRRIRALYPDHNAIEALVVRQGIDGFYESVDARIACCHIRKVDPLKRALMGAEGWITGLRADQSVQRNDIRALQHDAERGLLKLNPLFDWKRESVLAFATRNDVPRNALHANGFASIGCAPCTRAIASSEDERDGRWWWEKKEKKECGLHHKLVARSTAHKVRRWWPTLALATALAFVAGISLNGTGWVSFVEHTR